MQIRLKLFHLIFKSFRLFQVNLIMISKYDMKNYYKYISNSTNMQIGLKYCFILNFVDHLISI